jgi:hypothetical protein
MPTGKASTLLPWKLKLPQQISNDQMQQKQTVNFTILETGK